MNGKHNGSKRQHYTSRLPNDLTVLSCRSTRTTHTLRCEYGWNRICPVMCVICEILAQIRGFWPEIQGVAGLPLNQLVLAGFIAAQSSGRASRRTPRRIPYAPELEMTLTRLHRGIGAAWLALFSISSADGLARSLRNVVAVWTTKPEDTDGGSPNTKPLAAPQS